MYNNTRILTALLFSVSCLFMSCFTKVYPDEKMRVDSPYRQMFNAILNAKQFSFIDSSGRTKEFIITSVDSVISNKKGWFINGTPFAQFNANFREVGRDTTVLLRNNIVTVAKNPAFNGSGAIEIQFNNFYFTDSITAKLILDTVIQNIKISNVYVIKTTLKNSIKTATDITELFLSPSTGFAAFKTVDGSFWHRK